ncbi:MAG: cell division protein FtsZ [bacterium]
MQDSIQFEPDFTPGAKIKVVGVGGGGTNAVDSMVESGLKGVDFFVINTDALALSRSKAQTKIQIGQNITHGRGSGADPAIGEQAAVEAKDVIQENLKGADMIFITAGLGGGTGTGAAPVIAEIARDMGILTVAVVTRPFRFEGPQRMNKANQGLDRLRQFVDTCIIVSNDRLIEVVGPKTPLKEAFSVANNVLTMGVQSINDLISVPGLINVDFADVRTIMNETGGAVMGVGVGKGENRATEAVKKACASPLLDKIVIDGARGVLICVTGGEDMTLNEINEATTMVYEAASPDANIIFGAVVDEKLKDEIRVTIIATGLEDKHLRTGAPIPDDSRMGIGPGPSKERIESMFTPATERRSSAAAKTAEAVAAKKESAAAAASDAAHNVAAAAPKSDEHVNSFDFKRPDNPLRSSSAFAAATETGQRVRHQADEHGQTRTNTENTADKLEEKSAAAELREDDPDIPAFLKRRKNLFE